MKNIRQNKGFTLIELMIVVGVIGILAAIAYPSFRDAVLKARRADAMDGIMSIRLAQEKFRANCIEYARAFDATSDTCDNATPANNKVRHPATSGDEYYTLELDADTDPADATGYTIIATPTTKGGQDEDKCETFILKVDSGSVEKSTSAYTDHTSDGAKRCWRR